IRHNIAHGTGTARIVFNGCILDVQAPGVQKVGPEITWLDHGDENSKSDELCVHRLGNALHSEFGRAVDSEPSRTAEAAQRTDVEDTSCALRAHDWEHRSGDIEQAEDVDVIERSDGSIRRLLNSAQQA